MTGALEGKRAVITGGASGIGEAAVRAFREAGASVLLADLDAARGTALADELGSAVAFMACDVSIESDVAALIAKAMDLFGGIDCLWNNAGLIGEFGRADTVTWRGYQSVFAVLVGGVLLGTKYVAPIMRQQKSGCILNTASIASLLSGYGPHLYTSAKHAVLGFSRTSATELGRHNVRVNAICPGGIYTPMTLQAAGGGPEADGILRAHLTQMQPIPRPGMPRDVAALGVFLASDQAGFINGAAIPVDGGSSAGLQWNPMYEKRKA